ncbi:hypothetical protein SARC_02727 [Sphaeroforma arctica JP610]|uniref:Uncharacterized protein n=1 Tax=Sphaeroforma arctica JP610 TaxID=667725 RepID=A0A0L0G873_9EUKA|nr:hypothetical protein SARC_02727 [Sphaeroforma arctica JP610]KNC85066.1 hypothetical protein SARC_02727 [Sphaeroforma arctica JP610]|eukprot:XP_014158968.1 hypothetical protein SARC_02727 [Sphaeroforma arctica JP610]
MAVDMIDSVVLARHNKIVAMLFTQPTSSMLKTLYRLAGLFSKEPEKIECMLHNLHTCGMWEIMAHHSFTLMNRQAEEGGTSSTAGLFGTAPMAGAAVKLLAKAGVIAPGAPLGDFKVVDYIVQGMREHLGKAAKMTTREGLIAGSTL